MCGLSKTVIYAVACVTTTTTSWNSIAFRAYKTPLGDILHKDEGLARPLLLRLNDGMESIQIVDTAKNTNGGPPCGTPTTTAENQFPQKYHKSQYLIRTPP